MSNGQLIITEARKHLGVTEKPSGSNNVFFNTWFYGREVHDGDKGPNAKYPWCFTSASYIYAKAGFSLGPGDYTKGFAGCPYALRMLKDPKKSWGKLITKEEVQPGDLFIVDWDGNNTPDHVGIIEDPFTLATGGDFKTLEGNTSDKGSQSNGGEYMAKIRHFKTGPAIWYFIRPNVLLNPPKTSI